MLIIPVLDLRNGQAVAALAGRRDRYQPLSTPLCASADPARVVEAYRSLHPFTTFYLADLDAIERTGDNRTVVERLLGEFPAVTFWLDAGFARFEQLDAWPHSPCLRPVIGSESQADAGGCATLLARCAPRHPLLSLDFKDGRFLGPAALLTRPQLWPEDIIVMKLDRVGANRGPDTELPLAPGRENKRFFAAGGVRGADDLRRLQDQGVSGALVASALHDGRLGKSEIAEFTTWSCPPNPAQG